MPTRVLHLVNEHLSVEVNDDASALLRGAGKETEWRMGPVAIQEDGPIDVGHVWLRRERSSCEQYAGRFRGIAVAPDTVRYTLLGRLREEVGQFTCRYRLDGPWLAATISDIDPSLPSLIFPPPLNADSLVAPSDIGRWIRQPLTGRFFWRFFSHLNMRWFGGLKGDEGWLAVVSEGHADAGVLATGLSLSPGWLRSLGQWSAAPRTVRYRLCEGGYVGLARAFRAWAIDNGLHRPLEQKLAETPALANLHGGRLLSFMHARTFRVERLEDQLKRVTDADRAKDGQVEVGLTYRDAAAILEEALAIGMTRGAATVRGWIPGGYDESHPDVWPPEPAVGSVDELAALCRTADPVTVSLHDNYQDIYPQSPSWPTGVIRGPDGRPMPGGFWAGGQAYILNARDGLRYARRNWQMLQQLGPRGMFIDTTAAANLCESHEPGNTLTREQDELQKIELLRFFKAQGLAVGSEEAADFAAPYVDWLENRHQRVAGESIPLWPLVYHDAAFCGRYTGILGGPLGRVCIADWLPDMLWGYFLLWPISSRAQWERCRDTFRQVPHVDAWHERIGTADLLSHRYLTSDHEVEQTEFSTGVALAANFSSDDRRVDGVNVPAGGCVIRE